MTNRESLAKAVWRHPAYYAGFSPDGDFLILTQHRESGALDRSNYTCAMQRLKKACEGLPDAPEERLNNGFMQSRGDLSPRSSGWIYDWRARCSMVGWIEYLMVRKDAPPVVLDAAEDLLRRLDGYPVVDEDHFSQLEYDEACEYWEQMSVRERVELLKESRTSIFAARRAALPYEDNYVYERLIGA